MAFARTKDYVRLNRNMAIRKLVNYRSLSGARLSFRSRDALVQRLGAKFDASQAFIAPVLDDIISSQTINEAFEAIFVDLNTIYESFKNTAGAQQYRANVLDSRARRIAGSIRKVKQEVKRLEAMYIYPGYDDVIFIDFADATNYSTGSLRADVDYESHRLKLQRVATRDHTNSFFQQDAEITASFLTPGLTGNAGTYGPDKMVDPDPHTFWMASAMVDDPVTDFPVSLDPKNVDGQLISQADYSANGAVVEITLVMRKARWVNNVKLLPVGKYPVRVVQASYTPEEGGTYRQIPVFDVGLATQNIDQIDLSFEPIPVYAFKFILEQENYTKAQYQVPFSLINNNIFWQEVVDEGFGTGLAGTLTATPLSHLLADIEQMLSKLNYKYASFETREGIGKILESIPAMINRYTDRNRSLSAVYSRYKHDTQVVDIDKYEYVVGIRDIQINFSEYTLEGEWRSPRMIDNKGALQIELATNESHSVIDVNGQKRPASSIAYSVDLGRQVKIPVLPVNSVDNNGDLLVKSEVLKFDRRTLVAVTRFPVDMDRLYAVYADSVNVRTFGIRDYGTVAEITIPSELFNPNMVYTITYYPDLRGIYPVSAVRLDSFTSHRLEKPVMYTATGANNTIILPSYPYIEYQVMNGLKFFNRPDPSDGIWVYSGKRGTAMATDENGNTLAATSAQIEQGRYSRKLVDGIHYGSLGASTILRYEPITVTVDGSKAYNVTDYLTGEHPLMPQTTQTNKKYQFIHLRNKIILNAAVSNAKIEVMYSTKADHIQLVAELASNTGGSLAFTPIMKDAALLLRARYI